MTLDVRLATHQYYATDSLHQTVLLLVLDQLASDFRGTLPGDSSDISGHGQSTFRSVDLVLLVIIRLVYLSYRCSIDLWDSCLLQCPRRIRTCRRRKVQCGGRGRPSSKTRTCIGKWHRRCFSIVCAKKNNLSLLAKCLVETSLAQHLLGRYIDCGHHSRHRCHSLSRLLNFFFLHKEELDLIIHTCLWTLLER